MKTPQRPQIDWGALQPRPPIIVDPAPPWYPHCWDPIPPWLIKRMDAKKIRQFMVLKIDNTIGQLEQKIKHLEALQKSQIFFGELKTNVTLEEGPQVAHPMDPIWDPVPDWLFEHLEPRIFQEYINIQIKNTAAFYRQKIEQLTEMKKLF